MIIILLFSKNSIFASKEVLKTCRDSVKELIRSLCLLVFIIFEARHGCVQQGFVCNDHTRFPPHSSPPLAKIYRHAVGFSSAAQNLANKSSNIKTDHAFINQLL